ncbi:hypothetical protein M413DRAFT_438964 [Hebeloma cylindrosporum]|uniref:FAD-binding domain-containing protein n=1 Tax=Hebeloma cylindrosporum TaxID=76867 RepID=A0A0C2YJ86_HEBCY|nr:hypothetical protein M413DRAFT_438964 [Hebeloma cylindrosporum h7]
MSARENKRIVIIGAGPGGISCAIALKRKFGFVDVTVSRIPLSFVISLKIHKTS